MRSNNGFFSEGAYQWAESMLQLCKRNKPCILDIEGMLENLERRSGHDVKVCIFEPELDKDAYPILMIEWVEPKWRRISIYPIDKKHYSDLKSKYSGYVNLFKMNGRIRYCEECRIGRANLPTIVVED